MLNPVWLNTFKTLVEVGHFTQTADRLFMTQPGVSQHIRKLEEACGYPLLQRKNKSFELTEQGMMVYHYAQSLKSSEAALLERLGFDDRFSGPCRIACSGSLALLLYPHLLQLQQQHAQLVIQLEAAPNHRILQEIKQGSIDIGIVTDIPNQSLYAAEKLGKEQLCLVLPGDRAVTQHPQQQLTELGLIRHPDADHYLSLYFAKCGIPELMRLNSDDLPTSGYVNQLGQILLPVAKGLGFTVLPASAIDSFSDKQRLSIFTPVRPVSEELYMVKKRNRQLPARFSVLNGVIKQLLAERGGA